MELKNSILKRLCLLVLLPLATASFYGFGDDDNNNKILLRDVKVLTLYPNKMTKGRRSAAIQQLQCVSGGSASCSAFSPRVVQCHNQGTDGMDFQWECKTDMDNTFRFGSIDVSCEGYDYSDDSYVLAGSCGLKYSIDYTKEGMNQQNNQHNYYGDTGHMGGNGNTQGKRFSSIVGNIADLIAYVAFGLMIYAFYKTCISPSRTAGEDAYSRTSGDDPAGGGGGGTGGDYGWNTGARPGGTHRNDYTDNASCGRNRNATGAGAGMPGGGFWTGAATGGLLGYMFGNRGGYNYGGYNRGYNGGGGGGWFNNRGFGGGGGGGGFSAPSSSGTRSASGFGGTSRR